MPDVERITRWIIENANALRRKSPRGAADEISDHKLKKIDDRLGIEIAHPDDGEIRTAILTAFSNPDAFPLVFKIVDKLRDVPGWNFVALKPQRGFAFRVKISDRSIDSDALGFAAIPEVPGGYQLLVPGGILPSEQAEEVAWLIVETEIGEELAGRIQHLEFAHFESVNNPKPIKELAGFVKNSQ